MPIKKQELRIIFSFETRNPNSEMKFTVSELGHYISLPGFVS